MRSKTNFNKSLVILINSLILNYIFVQLSYKANEFELEQFAYIMFVSFPVSAFIIGILSEILLRKLWYAPAVSAISFAISIIAKYHVMEAPVYAYILAYAVISVIGFCIAFGIRKIISKLRK